LEVGKIIKEARLAKGLTQEQLGDIIGVTKSAIGKYESGVVVNIKRSVLQKLAIVLDINGSDLIQKEPTGENDGLPENILKLVDFAKQVPEDKADMILAVMKTIVKDD
jgi:transcriptional regulator with XRE-family HTH domain